MSPAELDFCCCCRPVLLPWTWLPACASPVVPLVEKKSSSALHQKLPHAHLCVNMCSMNALGDDHVSFSAAHLAASPCGRLLLVSGDNGRLVVYATAGEKALGVGMCCSDSQLAPFIVPRQRPAGGWCTKPQVRSGRKYAVAGCLPPARSSRRQISRCVCIATRGRPVVCR